MSPRWTSYVVFKPPKGGSKRQKCPKFEQYAAITPKRHEIGCQLLLITNRKSHTGFRFIPTSMTLNDLERRNSPSFAFSHRIRLLFFLEKTGDLFIYFISYLFAHHSPSLGSHLLFLACKTLPLLLWGPFLWGPYSAEHAEHA